MPQRSSPQKRTRLPDENKQTMTPACKSERGLTLQREANSFDLTDISNRITGNGNKISKFS
jgi:hypothetical protein